VIDPLRAIAAELSDRSLRVRRGGATGLIFAAVAGGSDSERVAELIDRVLDAETDTTMLTRALRARGVLENQAPPPL
jgi:hypothetical protein